MKTTPSMSQPPMFMNKPGNMPQSATHSLEQVEPHRCTHLVVAARAGMDAVPAVERRRDQVAVLRILDDLVEVDNRVKRHLRAHPLIHIVAKAGLRRVPPCVVLRSRTVVPRD